MRIHSVAPCAAAIAALFALIVTTNAAAQTSPQAETPAETPVEQNASTPPDADAPPKSNAPPKLNAKSSATATFTVDAAMEAATSADAEADIEADADIELDSDPAELAGLDEAAPDETVPYAKGRLWRIDKPGLPPSWLFGTMHVTDEIAHLLPDALWEAIDNARIVCLEMTIDAMLRDGDGATDPDRPAGAKPELLSRRIDPALFEAAFTFANTFFLVLRDEFEQYSPAAAAGLLSRDFYETSRMTAGFERVDDRIDQRAREANRDTCSLETPQSRWSVMRMLDDEIGTAMLRVAVARFPDREMRFRDDVAAYSRGEIWGLHEANNAAVLAELPSEAARNRARNFIDAFIFGRNEAMMKRAAPELEKGGVVLAVGAAHLPGARGMARLIALRGFTLTRVD